jgi:hypothetical protein
MSKGFIFSITSFFSIAGVIFSLLLPNIYLSKSILAPVEAQNSLNSALKNYGGVAGLAGINLPDAELSITEQAIQKISSLSFFTNNILPNIYLPDLMALDYWDAETNAIFYKENVFNYETQSWVRDFKFPKEQIPSPQESYEVFIEDHLSLSVDKLTGFVELSIQHQSPYIAKEWVELIVEQINSYYRIKESIKAEAASNYLNEKIENTYFTEIKQSIANLLEQKIQELTLIEANENYVFDYIDNPVVMEQKHSPSRAFICIIAAILGMIIGIILVSYNSFTKKYT